jgi:hypothetical protein
MVQISRKEDKVQETVYVTELTFNFRLLKLK